MFKRMRMKPTLLLMLQNYSTLKNDTGIHSYDTKSASAIHIIQTRANIRKYFFHFSDFRNYRIHNRIIL